MTRKERDISTKKDSVFRRTAHTCTDLMLLDMLTSTEIFIFFAVTALLESSALSPVGRAPYLGAMLVGIVNLRPSTSASCFNSMIYSISTLTVAPAGIFPMVVLKTSAVCCSSKLAGSFRSTAAWYVALASSFSFMMPSMSRLPT